MTQNYIESKLKSSSLIWILWMLLAGLGVVYMIIQLYDNYDPINKTRTVGLGLLLGILSLLFFNFLNEFKYIRVDKKSKILKWHSLLVPWGREVDLTKYSYKIKFSVAQSDSFYLIDDSMSTKVRIGGIFFKNFEELFAAVGLREIKNFDLNFWKYLKLIYFGRLKVEMKNKNQCH
jgi:hypothetical protein